MSRNDHAPIPFSGAPGWVQCAAWARVAAEYPEEETSPAAMEGTAAHSVVENLGLFNVLPQVGECHPNGIKFTQEMIDGAHLFYDTIDTCTGPDVITLPERRLPGLDPDNWGTPDYVMYSRAARRLDIREYKYGHRRVDPHENWQLINQAAAAIEHFGIDGHEDRSLTVTLTVVQPRCFGADPVRTWTIRGAQLRAHINILASRIMSVKNPAHNNIRTTGAECQFCRGRHACSAYQAQALEYLDISKQGENINLHNTTAGRELEYLRHAIGVLKGRASGLEEQISAAIRKGERVPGWALSESFGRTTWNIPDADVIAFAKMLGVDAAAPQKAKTPRQLASGLASIGMEKSALSQFTERPRGEAVLTKTDVSSAEFTPE